MGSSPLFFSRLEVMHIPTSILRRKGKILDILTEETVAYNNVAVNAFLLFLDLI